MKIGSLILSTPLLSAPMAGYTNYAFRELLRQFGGAGLIATEMVSAQAFIAMAARNADEPLRLAGVRDEPRPLAVQIWDHHPENLAKLADKLANEDRVSVIDLNFGCPAKQIAGKSQSGAHLLQFPEKIGEIVAACVAVCGNVPVTAKIRLGISCDAITANEVAMAVEEAGGAALTVHGRTASEMYRGAADWDAIARVKPFLKKIPLIGNGDITTVDIALARLRDYPVDGIMIGRAAMGQPWIFSQIAAAGGFGYTEPATGAIGYAEPKPQIPPTPTPREQREILLAHFAILCQKVSPAIALILMRKYACHYAHGKNGARNFRTQISRAATTESLLQIIREEFPVL